jgi:hypothetical protein
MHWSAVVALCLLAGAVSPARAQVPEEAGIAKIELDHPAVRLVNYMSLLKVGNGWTIVNQIFYREDKARS